VVVAHWATTSCIVVGQQSWIIKIISLHAIILLVLHHRFQSSATLVLQHRQFITASAVGGTRVVGPRTLLTLLTRTFALQGVHSSLPIKSVVTLRLVIADIGSTHNINVWMIHDCWPTTMQEVVAQWATTTMWRGAVVQTCGSVPPLLRRTFALQGVHSSLPIKLVVTSRSVIADIGSTHNTDAEERCRAGNDNRLL